MLARLFILAVCLPALALFCAGCAGLKPDHLSGGFEHDESVIHGPTRERMSTDKIDVHVIYDLNRCSP